MVVGKQEMVGAIDAVCNVAERIIGKLKEGGAAGGRCGRRQPASQGLSENEIGCARISMMARSTNAPFTGRIQKRKTNHLRPSHSA